MYHLFLATPEKVVFDDFIHSLMAPGKLGYLEILTDHAAIITTLSIGKLTVIDKDKKKWVWAISGGYLEVSHNKAKLLADAVELAAEIDLKRAEATLIKARTILISKDPQVDILRAKAALQRAENRIKIFHEFK